jgi:opacity protein-like surface antigen
MTGETSRRCKGLHQVHNTGQEGSAYQGGAEVMLGIDVPAISDYLGIGIKGGGGKMGQGLRTRGKHMLVAVADVSLNDIKVVVVSKLPGMQSVFVRPQF